VPLPVLPRTFLSAVLTNPLLPVSGLVRVAVTFSEESSRAVRIPTTSVAGERLEVDVDVHVVLEAVRASANMVATNPGALKNGRGRLLPKRRNAIFRNIVHDPSNIREPFDIAGREGQLGDLVGDRAAKYIAPLASER